MKEHNLQEIPFNSQLFFFLKGSEQIMRKEKCLPRIKLLTTLIKQNHELTKLYSIQTDCVRIQSLLDELLQEELFYAYQAGLLKLEGSDNDV